MRKKLFIKPRLQIQHLAWTLGVALLASVVGYLIFETMLKSILVPATATSGQWLEIRQGLRAGYAVVVMVLTIAIGLENYLLFHRIVGPLYALERGLKRVAEGQFNDVVQLRKDDQLKDLVAAFEEMKAILRQRMALHEKTAAELERLMADASLENIASVRSRLKEIREQAEKKAA